MNNRFDLLSEAEWQFLVDVPVLITILVGEADSEIDSKEKEWGKKLSHIRSFSGDYRVQEYYKHVEKNFMGRLNEKLKTYSNIHDFKEIFLDVSNELKKVNPILKKLGNPLAAALYKTFKSFAKQIARSSGGIFYFGSITLKENEVIDLPMIDDPAVDQEAD